VPIGYTPPAGNAVNLNFDGAYVPPAGNAVILNFFNTVAYTLSVDVGSFAVTGEDASVKAGRRLYAYEQLVPGMRADGFGVASIAGWTSGLSSFTLSNGQITVVDTGAANAYIEVTGLTPGRQYRLEGYLLLVSAAIGMAVGTTPGGQQLGSVLSFATGAVITANPVTNPAKSITFTAPGTSVYVSLFMNSNGTGRANYLRIEQVGRYAVAGTDASLVETGRILEGGVGAYAMTGVGVTMTVQRRLSADVGAYHTAPVQLSLYVGRKISATPGSYSIVGPDVTITHIVGRYIFPDAGTYQIDSPGLTMTVGRKLAFTPGSYALTGNDVSWVYARAIVAASGSYAINGVDVVFKRGLRLSATPGSYALTGRDVDLINRRLIAASGSYVLDGAATGLLAARVLQATPGAYLVAGSNVALLTGRRMALAAGSYSLVGIDLGIRAGRRLQLTAGSYALTGTPAGVFRGYTVHATPGAYAISWSTAAVVTTRRMIMAAGSYRARWPDVELMPTWRDRGPRAITVGFAESRYLAVEPQIRRVSVEPQRRYCSVEPAPRRYAAVEPRDKEPMGGSMLQWPEKDPNEVLDYELDWAEDEEPRLETGETLLTSAWSVVTGDVVIDVVKTDFTPQGLSTVWLSGGTPGTKCVLLNRVTTSEDRTYDKSVSLRIRNH
jgi:hypothetical protein